MPGTSPAKKPLRVLIVEDSLDDAELLLRELARDYDVIDQLRVETAQDMRTALSSRPWDIVISDYRMPVFSALEALDVLKQSELDIPFIIVSGTVGEEIAVEALKLGAHDFMGKGKIARLLPGIERELREAAGRTAGRRTERALRESEERFRALTETATDAIISTDSAGDVVYVNPAVERMFGHEAQDLIGFPLTRLMPERLRDAHRAGLARYLATSESRVIGRRVELIGLRADGAEFPIDLSLATWIAGDKTHFTAIIRDLTQEKKIEAQLVASERMASVGILAAGVAHEINNPLAAIIGNVELSIRAVEGLASDIGENPNLVELRDELADVREAGERVRDIVRDLKLFSRAEEERRVAVDVQRVLDSALRMAWNEIRHRARLVKDYQPIAPVEGNESRLSQVFLNLVINAAQAIPEGRAESNEIRVVTGTLDDGRVFVEIRDTGSGMTPEVMGNLFTPFFTTKPRGVGTGLGLSICHQIVTAIGGEIVVESRPGAGSTFRVLLAPSTRTTDAPRAVTASTAAPMRRGRILVVDDERMIVISVQRMLMAQHDVLTTTAARDALERIRRGERYDVILCDLMMPDMTGMDLHAEITRCAPQQAERIVFLTGGAFTQAARAFLDDVPNMRLEKPFDIATLRALVNDRIR